MNKDKITINGVDMVPERLSVTVEVHLNPILQIAHLLSDYLVFEDADMPLVLALWAASTYECKSFDAFAYLVITSFTKRSGKTRLSEILGMLCNNSQNSAGITPASMFKLINATDNLPTFFFDEAEVLSSESANTMRAFLNVGYRKGQTIPRVSPGGEVVNYGTYCPKAFILIGDVYDTLRDRSIIVTMKRAEPKLRFSFDAVSARAGAIKNNLKNLLHAHSAEIKLQYDTEHADFLSDRDEEIWRPLLALCSFLVPERYADLQRLAVDMCALKTTEKRRYSTLDLFEDEAESDEYADKLLNDCFAVIEKLSDQQKIFSKHLLEALKQLPLSPWRKFKGQDGLTAGNLADMLSRFGVHSKTVRVGSAVCKGYTCGSIKRAMTTKAKGR